MSADAQQDAKGKRPAFQFYPADWRKDVQLRACSLAARGLWIDLMCVMHECEPYGHLVLNGTPMTPAKLSGQIGVPVGTIRKLLDELIENGVARCLDDGTIYSKRMVDDERVRNARGNGGKAGAEHGIKGAEHGKKGGRPSPSKGGSETPLPGAQKPPPSSSSSSSTSVSTPHPPAGGVLGAEDSDPGATDRQPPPPDPDQRPPAEIPPQPPEAPTVAGAICAALRKAGIQRTNPGHPTLAALVQAGATVEELVALVPQTTGKADPFAYLLAAAVGQRQRAAETAKTLVGTAPPAPAADPQAWRRNTRDVMAMAEQLGVKARPGEGLQQFTERIVGAWMRAGQPALQQQRLNPQPQPQEAA